MFFECHLPILGNTLLRSAAFSLRYKSISHDLSVRKWSKRRVCVSLLIVWVVSFAVFIPETISVDTKDGDIECYKNMNLALIRANAVFLLLVEYVLPLCIIGFCNYKVIRVIKSRKMIRLQTQDMQERDNEQKKSVRYYFYSHFEKYILLV